MDSMESRISLAVLVPPCEFLFDLVFVAHNHNFIVGN